MRKIFSIFTIIFLCCQINAKGAILNFSNKGNIESNRIIKDLITAEEDFSDLEIEPVSFYYDIDNDGKREIFGFVKNGFFHSLKGYKLLVLKDNFNEWIFVDSDIYFDETKNLEIENNQITYHGGPFYKNKKFKAKYKNDTITTKKSIFDKLKEKKINHIEQFSMFHQGKKQHRTELDNISPETQPDIEFFYNGLSEKTQHYIK